MTQRANAYARTLLAANANREDNDLTHLAREYLRLAGEVSRAGAERGSGGWGAPFGAGPTAAPRTRGW